MSAHAPAAASATIPGPSDGAAAGPGGPPAPGGGSGGAGDFRNDGSHGGGPFRERGDNFRRTGWQNNPRQGGSNDHRMRFSQQGGGDYISDEMRPGHRGRGGRNFGGNDNFGNRSYNRPWQDNGGQRGRRGGGVGGRGMQHPSGLSLNRMSSTDSQSNDQRNDFNRGGNQGPNPGRGLYGEHNGRGNTGGAGNHGGYTDARFGNQMKQPQGGYGGHQGGHNRLPNSPMEDSRRRRDPTAGNVDSSNSRTMLHGGPPPPPPAGGAGQPPPGRGHDSPGRPMLESPVDVGLMQGGAGLMAKQTSPPPQGPLLHFAPNGPAGNELQQPPQQPLQRSPGDWHARAPVGNQPPMQSQPIQSQPGQPQVINAVVPAVGPAGPVPTAGTVGAGPQTLQPSMGAATAQLTGAAGPQAISLPQLQQPVVAVGGPQTVGLQPGMVLGPPQVAARRIWASVPSDELPPQMDPSHRGPDPLEQPGYVTKGLNLALSAYVQSLKDHRQQYQHQNATAFSAAAPPGPGAPSTGIANLSPPPAPLSTQPQRPPPSSSSGAPRHHPAAGADSSRPVSPRTSASGAAATTPGMGATASPAVPPPVITPAPVLQPISGSRVPAPLASLQVSQQPTPPSQTSTPAESVPIAPVGPPPVPASPQPNQRSSIANTAVAVAEAHMHQQQMQAQAVAAHQQLSGSPGGSVRHHSQAAADASTTSRQIGPVPSRGHPLQSALQQQAIPPPIRQHQTVSAALQEEPAQMQRQMPEGAILTTSGVIRYPMEFLLSLRRAPSVLNRPRLQLQPGMSPPVASLSRDVMSQSSFGSRHTRRTSTGKANVPQAPQRAQQPKPQPAQPQRGIMRPGVPRDVALRRHVKGLLNKMTVERFILITDGLANALEQADDENLLRVVVEEVYAKSVSEPNFSEMYADLVVVLRARSPWFLPADPAQKPTDFVRLLVIACQTEFDSMEDFAKLDLPPEMAKEMSDDDIEVERTKRKIRTLGNMRFIGELFMRRVLSYKALTHILYAPVLKSEDFIPEAHVVECLCELLTTIGLSLEQVGPDTMNVLMHRLKHLQETGGYELRIFYKIQDLLDLRDNKWKQQHHHAQKANTLSAVKQGDTDNDVAGLQSAYPYKDYVRQWDEQWPAKKTQMKTAWEDYAAKCATGSMGRIAGGRSGGAIANTGSDMSPAADSPVMDERSPHVTVPATAAASGTG